jgi:hypothetical protein
MVDKVEQLKSAIRILLIWSSTVFLALAMNGRLLAFGLCELQLRQALQAAEAHKHHGSGLFRLEPARTRTVVASRGLARGIG